VDQLPWGDIGKITGLSGTGMLALVVVGFLKGWIWPAFAVRDILKQRDDLARHNDRLVSALSRCLRNREAE
jgi:hypothetical protein